MMGLKFKERGQIGRSMIDYKFLWITGPLSDILLPVDPKGVEITIPSPQMGAKSIKSLS